MNPFARPSEESPNATSTATLTRSKSGFAMTRSKSMGKVNSSLGRDSVVSMGRAMSGQLSKDAKAKILRLNTHTFHGVAPPDKRVEQFYDLGAEIGKGAFGVVRECIDIETDTKLCCKSIPRASLTDEMFADIQMEAEIMMHLRGHPNVVEIMGLFQDETHIHIVQELCTGGDLYGKLTKNPVPPTEKEIAIIMRQALTVLQHCHAMGVIYRDCKPDNFLLSSKGPDAVLKATDFGISKFLKHGDKLTEFCGTPQYMAPEIFDLSYGFPADTWAAGVTMYWLFCQEFPFKGKNKMDLGRKIATAEPEMTGTMWENVTPDAKDLIKRMLEKDPNKRCTPTGALNHKWFKKMAGVKTDSKPLAPIVLQRMRTFARMPAFKQEVLRHIARTLDAAYLVGVLPMFMAMNENNSKGIDIAELTKGLEAHGVKVDATEVKNIMYKVDGDLNGEIDFHEFASALLTCGILTRKDLLQEAFDHYDTDKDGNINRHELEAVLKSHNLPEARIAKIIADIDNCGMDGRVDFVAFRNLMLETTANSDVDEFWATRRTYTRTPMAPIARPQYVVFGNSYKPQNTMARYGSGGMTRSASQPLHGAPGATPDSAVKSSSGARTWTHKDSSYWGNSTGGASKDNSVKGANHYARTLGGTKSPAGSSPGVSYLTSSNSEPMTLSRTPSSEKESDKSDRVLHKVASVFKSFLKM